MIRQIERAPFDDNAREVLMHAESCWLEVRPEDRRNSCSEKLGETSYYRCPEILLQDDVLYLGLAAEKCPAGSLMTQALWFGKTVSIVARGADKVLRIRLHADWCHISGGMFKKLLEHARAAGHSEDLAVVWETSFVSEEELPELPKGAYQQGVITLFEMHYDNPELIRNEMPMEKVLGCRFSLAPMSDDFIDIILSSIAKVDTSRVWSMTDELSTVYRGRRIHVLDALKACLLYSYRSGVHMTMNATISEGCPGDAAMDEEHQNAVWNESDTRINEEEMKDIRFPAVLKFALYPMGRENYLEPIGVIIQHARDRGILERTQFYATVLKGDIHELFSYLEWVCAYGEEHLGHYVVELSAAVNLPEEEEA